MLRQIIMLLALSMASVSLGVSIKIGSSIAVASFAVISLAAWIDLVLTLRRASQAAARWSEYRQMKLEELIVKHTNLGWEEYKRETTGLGAAESKLDARRIESEAKQRALRELSEALGPVYE